MSCEVCLARRCRSYYGYHLLFHLCKGKDLIPKRQIFLSFFSTYQTTNHQTKASVPTAFTIGKQNNNPQKQQKRHAESILRAHLLGIDIIIKYLSRIRAQRGA